MGLQQIGRGIGHWQIPFRWVQEDSPGSLIEPGHNHVA
jgi:hypothetical protein